MPSEWDSQDLDLGSLRPELMTFTILLYDLSLYLRRNHWHFWWHWKVYLRAQDFLDTDVIFQKPSTGDEFVEERQKRGFIMMRVKVKHNIWDSGGLNKLHRPLFLSTYWRYLENRVCNLEDSWPCCLYL